MAQVNHVGMATCFTAQVSQLVYNDVKVLGLISDLLACSCMLLRMKKQLVTQKWCFGKRWFIELYPSCTIRPMDLSLIKKKIETGVIRNDMEFQRDMLLMFQNAIMYNSSNHDV